MFCSPFVIHAKSKTFSVYKIKSTHMGPNLLYDFSKLGEAPTPSNFIAGRPKATLLFWFFGDFRSGVS